jgi:hypothetical protein
VIRIKLDTSISGNDATVIAKMILKVNSVTINKLQGLIPITVDLPVFIALLEI